MASRQGTLSDVTLSVLDELSDTAKEKVPVDVYTQLTTGFIPAVKEISRAGTELLKAYQGKYTGSRARPTILSYIPKFTWALKNAFSAFCKCQSVQKTLSAVQKCSDQYVHSLRTLITSSTTAFPGAKKYGEDLEGLLTDYDKLLHDQKAFIGEFASIVAKTTGYSNEEREKVKDMFSKFQKQEKDLEKQRKKGSKTAFDQQQFVEDSAKEFLRQQEMRYRFFFEKHRNWFNMYPSNQANNNNVTGVNNHETDRPKNNKTTVPSENDFMRQSELSGFANSSSSKRMVIY